MKRIVLLAAVALSACGGPSTASNSTPTPGASAASVPQARSATSVAYDEAHHNVVLFGGLAGQTVLGDTWTWTSAGWTSHQGLTVTPSPRQGAAMGYDEASQQVILFGGGSGASGSASLNDTWAWDGAAWRELHPDHSPPAREGAAIAYDPSFTSLLVFGGMDDATGSTLMDTWSWNGHDWLTSVAPFPGQSVRPRMGFLPAANLAELYGDCGPKHDATVYGFDGGWGPKGTSGDAPPALCLPGLASNTDRRLIVLFGGKPTAGGSPSTSTWNYDGNVWSRQSPTMTPPSRYDAAMVYDSDDHVVVLFGGLGLATGHIGALNDTWTWNGTAWSAR